MKLMGMRQQSFSKSDTMFLTFLTAFVKQDPNFPFLLILLFHSLETKMERERVNHVREDRYREYGPNGVLMIFPETKLPSYTSLGPFKKLLKKVL